MAIELPLWMQDVEFSARQDRQIIKRFARSEEKVFEGLEVTQNGVGTFFVDVSAGGAVIQGDDISDQGMYLFESTASETIEVPPSPGAGTRTDTVIARVNDAQAGGAGTPADEGVIECIEGTTIPDTAIALAEIARTDVEAGIFTAAITDVRVIGPNTVVASVNGADGIVSLTAGDVDAVPVVPAVTMRFRGYGPTEPVADLQTGDVFFLEA